MNLAQTMRGLAEEKRPELVRREVKWLREEIGNAARSGLIFAERPIGHLDPVIVGQIKKELETDGFQVIIVSLDKIHVYWDNAQ